MDQVCQHCNSFNFKDEKTSDGDFTSCCHKGKVQLPLFQNTPIEIVKLLTEDNQESKNFRENIRNYNTANAFASTVCKMDENLMKKKGTYLFRINGEVNHYTSQSLNPQVDQDPTYSQLYFLDSSEATEVRMKNRANSKCLPRVMAKIDEIIRKYNPYYRSFKQLKQIEQEEEAKSITTGEPIPEIQMAFKKCASNDPRRYNLPTNGEVAVVFTGQDGLPPENRDFIVYPKNNNNNTLTKLNILSENLDPMCYPLLQRHGEPGWRPGIQHVEQFRFLLHLNELNKFYFKYLYIKITKT